MSENETVDTPMATEEAITKTERKRVRHRKKQLYERILRQMEFYFSDANLTKDRYLGELSRTDPDVPIDVFLKFNKIRALTHDIADIAKALRSSELLVCSEDNLKVRRRTPLLPYDAEQRTIYVESVPASASRDWLQGVFTDYGPVAYISLPKFKDSQRIKGFAFIEFEKPEDAQKCLNAFTKMGCKLPTSMPPEELSTIKMFTLEQPPEDKVEDAPIEEPKGSLKGERVIKRAEEEKKEEDGGPPRKKQKRHKKSRKSVDSKNIVDSSELNAMGEKDSLAPEEGTKSLDTSTEDIEKSVEAESKEEASSQEDAGRADDKKKKSRKRTAKERNKSKSGGKKTEAPVAGLWGLQVLSKTEWRVLRNKYLNLQRKRMKELKCSLRMRGVPHSASAAAAHAPRTHRAADREAGAATGDAAADAGAGAAAAAAAEEERPDGVFVRVELPEPCLDVRLTKRQVRSNVHAQHVDVKEGQREMVVRFDTPDAAAQYCSSGVYAEARVLDAAEAAAQWERAAAAREAGAAGARRARGRTRLLQRAAAAAAAAQPPPPAPRPEAAATHVRFHE